MSLIGLILALALIGFAIWCINSYPPMDPTVKRVLNVVVIIVVIIWLMSVFGLLDELRTVKVPRL